MALAYDKNNPGHKPPVICSCCLKVKYLDDHVRFNTLPECNKCSKEVKRIVSKNNFFKSIKWLFCSIDGMFLSFYLFLSIFGIRIIIEFFKQL